MIERWLTRFVRLTKAEYFADFFITPPITVALAVASLRHGAGVQWVGMFLVGLVAWTLYEYVTHRWLLHHWWILSEVHALHHDDQRDYIAAHPAVTILLYAAFWGVFGIRSSAVMVGFSVGYVIYAAAHTAFHHSSFHHGTSLYWLKRRHALHHRFDFANFGVTTPVWDILFGTEF
jgi:sterol desaturase/sphingolipid hydroxylase (fatty acid hydroxylase superfamily)